MGFQQLVTNLQKSILNGNEKLIFNLYISFSNKCNGNMYVTPEKARRHFNVSDNTLRKWDREGKIETIRVGKHRRYNIDSGARSSLGGTEKQRICYCRVSTSSQKEDLKRQIQFFKSNYPEYTIISDIGSGINFKRKGLKTILDSAIKGNIQQVVVTHKDRLCRFGFELYEGIIREYSNGEILVLNQKKTSPEQELVDDLISIITVFSSRLYGLRSNTIKNKIRTQIKDSEGKIITIGSREGTTPTDHESVSLVL